MLRKVSWLGAFVLVFALLAQGAAQRTGAWVDEVVAVEEPSADAGVLQVEIGAFDAYAFSVADHTLFQRVQENPDLSYVQSFGSSNELTFNPSEFEDGRLNPFVSARVREAMNWLIDREFIVQEIYGGLANPRYTVVTTTLPDYARLVDTIRALEVEYGYDPERAREVITEEMEALGAELVGGTWQYQGAPVEIIFLIRTEDERLEIGDYVASQLEDLGFTVTRDYRTAAEASPVWSGTDPAQGLYHIVTGGWGATIISRDVGAQFNAFYTPRTYTFYPFQVYDPEPELADLADVLASREFRTLEERQELFARALELSMQNSYRVWIVDQAAFWPHRADLAITGDLAAGIAGTYLWARTVRKGEQEGGTFNVALPSMLTNPWNPIAGSNWLYDMMMVRGTSDPGLMPDPFTGLYWPNRIERAEVFIEEGLPVGITHDWVTLEFVPENQVPEDAWADWDAAEQRFITVGERFPEGVTANRRVVVYYPEDFYDTVSWHDGSPITLGDFVMGMILTFDRAKEESPIFDEAAVPGFDSFMRDFRGVRILQENPLVIEHYSDLWFLDAEWNVFGGTWFPEYTLGPGAWHNLVPGILAEMNGELAFSEPKADRTEVEWTSFIAGPSIPILAGYLSQAAGEGFIPYEPTLGQYITPEEASQRYENLQAWHSDKGHFWLGTGPFFLERAFPVERTVQLIRFEDYPDPADRWELFEEPMLAEVEVDGPGLVTIGEAAEFDVFVDFAGEAYPAADIDQVRYLVFDAAGELVLTGDAEVDGDGLWRIVLSAEETAQLPEGSNRLEVAVVPLLVSIPAFDALEFVTTQ